MKSLTMVSAAVSLDTTLLEEFVVNAPGTKFMTKVSVSAEFPVTLSASMTLASKLVYAYLSITNCLMEPVVLAQFTRPSTQPPKNAFATTDTSKTSVSAPQPAMPTKNGSTESVNAKLDTT